MGFCHQLRLLLWKNFTLKKRSPFVLIFELFIPLVLFVILLSIRKRQPARPANSMTWSSQPLPSSGVLPILQSFCESNHDEPGNQSHHHHTKQESSTAFLTRIQQLAKSHNFFYPGYTPTEMEQLPVIYKSIIDSPATLHDSFEAAHNFELGSVLQTNKSLMNFMEGNLSLSAKDSQALLHSSVNVKELYKLLFGSNLNQIMKARLKRGIPSNTLHHDIQEYLHDNQMRDLLDGINNFTSISQSLLMILSSEKVIANPAVLKSVIGNYIPYFKEGILFNVIEGSDLQTRKTVINFLNHILNQVTGEDVNDSITPQEIAEILKIILLSPVTIKEAVCDKNEMLHLLIPEPPYTETDLVEAGEHLCNMTDAETKELSQLLNSSIDLQTIITVLHLHAVNISELTSKVNELLESVEKFYQFQTTLYELSVLAEDLPQTDCDYMQDNGTTENPPFLEKTTPSPITGTGETKKNKFAGLLKFWDGMQRTICGYEHPPRHRRNKRDTQKDMENINLDDLGLSWNQQQNLKILIHVLYSNPKVLYAPNNTAANSIINKANESFEFVDRVSEYARKWLNVSADLRSYLQQNSTADNLKAIKKMQEDIRSNHGLLMLISLDPRVTKFLNLSIPNLQSLLHEIDTIDNAACSWSTLLSGINLNVFKGFSTEQELVNYFLTQQYAENISAIAGVVFENINKNGSLPAHIRYKIRQNATFTPTTKRVRDRYWYPGPGGSQYPYYSFGFVWIQDIIERAIIDVQVGHDVVEPGTYLRRFPYPCWLYDQFVFMIEHVMPLCLTISWVYSVAMLVQSIVYEKEQRLKEVMKMMGLNNAVHWCAWFTTAFLQMTVTMGILTAMLKFGKVLNYSNPLLVFTVLEVFAIATISFSFLVSSLYSKAKVAAACAGIVYFLTYVPYMYVAIKEDVAGDDISSVVKTLVSLFSTTAFGLGGKYFAFYEEAGVGVQWNNVYVSPMEDDDFNLLMVVLMMIFDAFLYCILAWYIENVFPGSYGLPKPWYFPFTKSYWCGGHAKVQEHECPNLLDWCRRSRAGYLSVMEEDQACAMEREPEYANSFEMEPSHLPLGVKIENLTKVYKTGKKLAVKNLSLRLYEGQITSFLGHNGAGKTTTMSILTGLFPPTSGSATIYGHDIRMDMEVIRQGLGMCPQHNVLFDKLTVEEHLWFYSRLKGMKTSDMNQEMEMMIEDLGLPKKRHSQVDCLSGGMQRKLSVAIAFVGGSRTVILDEPTAGVDPYARRAIWDLLIKYKSGRTILLSTHHMDEADFLGDRIAIISNGQLKCCGSPLFLKNTFGEGYHLYLVKKESEEDIQSADELDDSENSQSFHVSKCQESKVTEFINKHVMTAYVKSDLPRELHYILPYEEAKKGNFEKLFNAFESGVEDLHISSLGVADTTLEEVFLKVTETAYQEDQAKSEDKPNEAKSTQPKMNEPRTTADSASWDGSVPFSDMLDQACGGQPEADVPKSTNQGAENELELGHMTENIIVAPMAEASIMEITTENLNVAENRGNPNQRSPIKNQSNPRDPCRLEEGRGSYVLSKKWRMVNHFRAVIVKRFHYITRNWKGLFSQILLPALFVSVAMTVALSAPKDEDPPLLELSPSQYFNLTQPRGNYIPFSNEHVSERSQKYLNDASPDDIIRTFHLPSGVGATCVLKKPFNNSFDSDIFHSLNISQQTFELLSRYYEPGCERVFVSGIRLENYVPQAAVISTKGQADQINSTSHPPDVKGKYYPSCYCSADNTGYICSEDGYSMPPQFRVVTRDILQDITQSTADPDGKYYLYTTDAYRLHRYGAFGFGSEVSFVPDDFGQSSPTQFRRLAVRGQAIVWYNNKGYHSMPVYLNTLNNAVLRANLPKSKGNPAAYGITLINHPMNQTNNRLNMDYILQGSDVLIAIFIIVAMSFVPASFVVFLVYERSINAKHLQFVSGLNPVMYWLANYVWDMCNYVIPAFCIIVILIAFQIPAYVSPSNLPAVIALFFLYGWSMTPLMYPASFKFNEPSTAYIFLIVINLFTGITCLVSSFLLEIFSYDKDLNRIHTILKDVFLIFPNYCLGRGLVDIAYNEYMNEYYFKTGQYNKMKSPFEWDLISRKLVAMSLCGLIFFILTLLTEYRFFIKQRRHHCTPTSIQDEDVDVAAERKRVLRGNGKNDLLRLENLTKVYKTRKLGRHLAVDRLCLGVPAGECFGLLGVNGAGKTTTFKMLTGYIQPSSGDANLNRYSILKDMLQVQQNIGYCPQFDALFDELTATEHIQLYCRLRGIPPKEEKRVVDWALSKLDLQQYANKPSGTYSGGNKRKLSTALALIGHPSLIFMDEPTTGMDPHSRRFLWDLVLGLIKDGRSVILTSHCMEECEALCTRLAIMVNGRFKCLGSIQHLKNKFGEGYTFSLRLKGPDYDRAQRLCQRFIQQNFPEAVLKEYYYNVLQYELKSRTVSLSYLFSKLEEAQKNLGIEDYSVSQNTLDNVFINFVKQQTEIVQESQESGTSLDMQQNHHLQRDSDEALLIPDVGDDRDLETDDDDILLRLDSSGTRLTLLNMDPLST
ncbi:hypothetical protein CHS0354_026468 [Potamilus streckersoni]|nr:hypothetical protein CHS0354_026468 [Potamilus streckersoni]